MFGLSPLELMIIGFVLALLVGGGVLIAGRKS